MRKIILLFVTVLISNLGYSQLNEGFEAALTTATMPVNPLSWTQTSGNWAVFDNGIGTGVRWDINNTLPNQGSIAAYCSRENIGAGNTSEDFLATPAVLVPTNGQLKFWTRQYVATDFGTQYEIRVKPVSAGAQNDPTGYVTIQNWTESTLNATYNVYEEKTVSLNGYANQNVYVAFVMVFTQPGSAISGDRWLVDDVKINQLCVAPTTLGASSITQNSAVLNWGNPAGATSFQIENGLSPLTQTGVPTGTSTTNKFQSSWIISFYHIPILC